MEIIADDTRIVFGEGICLSYLAPAQKRPLKHQLLIEFDDGGALLASVRMYGGIWAFREGDFDNPYYQVARGKCSPLADEFTLDYFVGLVEGAGKLSAKAFLATEQRIPGLGNGVLQDIMFYAGVHPRRKLTSLSDAELEGVYNSVRSTLRQMTEQGGRDTERDLFGQSGGYQTIMSKNNVVRRCPSCDSVINKEAYMGGSVYYCPQCQRL